MTQFDDIRPFNDGEVRTTLNRLIQNPEFCHAIASLKQPRLSKLMPGLVRILVKRGLERELKGIETVFEVQALVKRYMDVMMVEATSSLTFSGLDQLDANKAYLFVSNHRDIAMDPAFVGLVLFNQQFEALRVAIGDNLLKKPYVSDLMRLNKCFIVNRSATSPRDKLKAAKHLSSYIHHSIVEDNASVWIAQREGRAKDGIDKTNSAVVGMFALSKAKKAPLLDYIAELNIVPVSISYELDPCDEAKARELYAHNTHGAYEKDEHEDVASIATGITGQKGHVHVAFGQVLKGNYQDTSEVVAEIDQQIIGNYVLHATNCIAWKLLHGESPKVLYTEKHLPFVIENETLALREFETRLSAMSADHKEIVLAMYANPVTAKLAEKNSSD